VKPAQDAEAAGLPTTGDVESAWSDPLIGQQSRPRMRHHTLTISGRGGFRSGRCNLHLEVLLYRRIWALNKLSFAWSCFSSVAGGFDQLIPTVWNLPPLGRGMNLRGSAGLNA
jgi:hypothetical protein